MVLIIIISYLYKKDKRLKNELVELNATKDKFFSIVAHDLKGPIGSFNNLLNYISTSYSDFTDNEKIDAINNLRKGSERIYKLLNDLLTWSKSQRGNLNFSPEKTGLYLITERVIDVLSDQASIKSVTILNRIDKNIYTKSDVNMLETILRNLVTNAIKFSNKDGVVEIYECPSETLKKGLIQVCVKDNGIGMDKETMDKLFKIDSSFSKPGTDDEKGTGLGLIISKEFTEIHGGQFSCESKPGKGSIFSFSIPLWKNEKDLKIYF